MFKSIILAAVLMTIPACSMLRLPGARCDDHLVPINSPTTDARGSAHPVPGYYDGDTP